MVQRLHHRPEDFDDGDLGHRIFKFTTYVLRDLPTESVRSDHLTHPDLVSSYRRKLLQQPDYPPIVYDLVADQIIDGNHRTEAAMAASLPTIRAYVGLPEHLDRDWSENGDEWE